ncbi:hypothetical protein ACKWTF_015824 [Chironomus riparius]
MYRGRGAVDSHWQLAAGIFMMFIGQGADFSRRNHFILAFLLNIIYLSVFLLSKLYEGAITSSMIEPVLNNRLMTVKDLVESNYKVVNDAVFAELVKNLTEFDSLKPRMNLRNTRIQQNFSIEVTSRQFAYIFRCDVAEAVMRTRLHNGRPFTDYYYILPDIIFWNYVSLDASYLNPFIDRFQYFMDLSFQAGLPHMWKVFLKQSNSQLKANVKDDKVFLELIDFQAVFIIFFIFCGLSLVVLIAEIFHHDCLNHIKIPKIKIRSYCQKMKFWKKKKPNFKVRKIFIRRQVKITRDPMNPKE